MRAEDSDQTQGGNRTELDGLCRVVIPGDLIGEIPDEKKVILGPGLTREGVEVRAIKCGLLKSKGVQGNHPVFWVDTHNKRYVPVKGENVLGIVTNKGGDNFRVDIGKQCKKYHNRLFSRHIPGSKTQRLSKVIF